MSVAPADAWLTRVRFRDRAASVTVGGATWSVRDMLLCRTCDGTESLRADLSWHPPGSWRLVIRAAVVEAGEPVDVAMAGTIVDVLGRALAAP